MWYELFQAFLAPAITLLASAAEVPIIPLPQTFDPPSLVSSHLLAKNFSNNPQIAQAQVPAPGAAPRAQLEVFLINRKPCAGPGYHLTYRIIVRNKGLIPATDIVTQNQYPAGTTWSATDAFPTADRPPDEHDQIAHLLIWREGFLAPGDFVSYTFTVKVIGAASYVDNVSVGYGGAAGAGGQASSNNVVAGQCPGQALVAPQPRDAKQPVDIFCDVTQPGCTPILPKLGVNFERAQNPTNQVRICAPTDPAGCVPNRPQLGTRFAEAIADIAPGDCRVLSDDVISSPDFQDALTRQTKPAAFYLEPLHQAGLDFQRLVLENAFLGIAHTKRAQARLQDLQAPGKIAATLQDLQKEYDQVQAQRKTLFPPLITPTLEKAIDSIRRACGGDQTNNGGVLQLQQALPAAQQTYEQHLDQRAQAYRNMLQIFLQQSPAPGPQAFAELFAKTFVAHQKEDEASDNRFRLQTWEVALDSPKTSATACQAENTFAAPVEGAHTWCESNHYGLTPAPALVSAKAPQGLVAPPDTNALPPIGPEPVAGAGAACRGLPGDPWWASDCSCQCGQILPGAEGTVRTCQDEQGSTKRITRHDIFVTSQEECLAEGAKHDDPFF